MTAHDLPPFFRDPARAGDAQHTDERNHAGGCQNWYIFLKGLAARCLGTVNTRADIIGYHGQGLRSIAVCNRENDPSPEQGGMSFIPPVHERFTCPRIRISR